MKCPFCGSDMEKGQCYLRTTSEAEELFISDKVKESVINAYSSRSVEIQRKFGQGTDAYHCKDCHKIIAIFDDGK